MDIDTLPLPTARSFSRQEESRLPRSLRGEDAERPQVAGQATSVHARQDDYMTGQNGRADNNALLTLEQTTELFRQRLEDAKRDTDNAYSGPEEISEVARPKLTLDLGHSNIARVPESVIHIIKNDVERLSLSRNQIWSIPSQFSECTHLRYLNIRSNMFKEIPFGVYKLPELEILDISNNRVRKISREIKNLTSLKVFAIEQNCVDDLPYEICEMTKLQILKIADNPLRFKLKKTIEAKETEVAFWEMTDHEKETVVTAEIKRHLRETQPAIASVEPESGGEFSEGPGDTPKPSRRNISRFPVIPSTSTSASESPIEHSSRSPGQTRPPPIPIRSHHRMPSGHVNGTRRPSIAPLGVNSERNRSNSESVLQASAAARNKRLGLKRERSDLDTVEESKSNRHSHLRGFSYGSVLRTRNGNLPSPYGPRSSSPGSPRDARKQRFGFVKRLSSLPEHKQESGLHNPVIEGAKGVLYALYQVHPHISGVLAAIKGNEAERSPLERAFFNAACQVDRLNEALEQADMIDPEDRKAVDATEDAVQQDCTTCLVAYTQVSAQLQDSVRQIVTDTDARYVRTLMLLLYGSIIEVRHAVSAFGVQVRSHKKTPSSGSVKQFQTIPEEIMTPPNSIRTGTPTRERIAPVARPGARLRSDTAIQHPITGEFTNLPRNPQFLQTLKLPQSPPMHHAGSTLTGSVYHSAASSMSNGTAYSAVGSSIGFRSRSHSRNNFSFTNSSHGSSVTSTPKSGEQFNLPPFGGLVSRVNPATGLTDAQEEAVFEQIFLALTKAYDSALTTIPIAKRQFTQALEAADRPGRPRAVKELWATLVWRCQSCLENSEELRSRLVNMRLKDPIAVVNGAGSGRNDHTFWQLCKTFMRSFVDLVQDMKEAKSLHLLSHDIIIVLRPVQKASREAGRLIDASPWRNLADSATTGQIASAYAGRGGTVITGGSSQNNNVSGSAYAYGSPPSAHATSHALPSPFPPPSIPVPAPPAGYPQLPTSAPANPSAASPATLPLPATPLSAALGPAAQATVPTAVATFSGVSFGGASSAGGSEGFFSSRDVFQRADTLLNMPQAGNINFLNRR